MTTSATTAEVVAGLRQVARARGPIDRRQALSELAELPGAAQDSALGRGGAVTEASIRAAIDSITDPTYRDAATALLLDDEPMGYLTGRRHHAARVIGVTFDTFRRRYESRVLEEVAYWLTNGEREVAARPVDATAGPAESSGVDEAAAIVAKALDSIDNAVVLVGTLMLVKTSGTLVGRTLSSNEIEALGKIRHRVLTDPVAALAFVTKPDE